MAFLNQYLSKIFFFKVRLQMKQRCKAVCTMVIPFLQRTEKFVVGFCSVSERSAPSFRHFLAFSAQQHFCTISSQGIAHTFLKAEVVVSGEGQLRTTPALAEHQCRILGGLHVWGEWGFLKHLLIAPPQ